MCPQEIIYIPFFIAPLPLHPALDLLGNSGGPHVDTTKGDQEDMSHFPVTSRWSKARWQGKILHCQPKENTDCFEGKKRVG